MADNKEVKSNRERYMERLKSKYPDREFADDEAVYGQANEDYDGYDKKIADYEEREKGFSDLFSRDPRSAAFLTNWRQGGNPVVELVRMFGDDFVEEMKNPERQEELAKASKEFMERLSKEKEFEEQYEKNISETLSTIEAIKQEEGRTDDEIDDAMAFLSKVMHEAALGKYSRESFAMAFKALNHDTDTEAAAAEGEVKGRNAKIEEKLRKPQGGDGMPDLAGKNGSPSRRNGQRSMFDIADEAR